jgi:hypothetical protein
MYKKQFSLNVVAAVVAGVLTIFGLPNPFKHSRATSSASPTIAELVWMSGNWQTAADKRPQIEEYWTRPADGSMLGNRHHRCYGPHIWPDAKT